jgi:hypothetical protein
VEKGQGHTKVHRAGDPVILAGALLHTPGRVNRPRGFSAEDDITNFILSGIEKSVTRAAQRFKDARSLSTQTLRVPFQKAVIVAQANVNLLHRRLKFILTLLIVMKNTDAKWLKWLDDFLPKHTQRFGRMGSDEHALSLGQQMTEEIRNGVRFASAGRPLYEDTISTSELSGDFKLLTIGRLTQENVVILISERKPAGVRLRLTDNALLQIEDLQQRKWKNFPARDVLQHQIEDITRASASRSHENHRLAHHDRAALLWLSALLIEEG